MTEREYPESREIEEIEAERASMAEAICMQCCRGLGFEEHAHPKEEWVCGECLFGKQGATKADNVITLPVIRVERY